MVLGGLMLIIGVHGSGRVNGNYRVHGTGRVNGNDSGAW
jgi:hypothetical protein